MPFLRHTLPFRRKVREKRPAPLPRQSPKLTPPNQEVINASQQQSFFFTKLPAEVRLLVYDLILPQAKNSHVVHQYLRANQVAWPSDSIEFTEKHAAFWHGEQEFIWAGYAWPWPGRVVPNALLVCWRLYDETLNYLYSTRFYHFDSPIDLLHLHRSTPHKPFNAITTLRLVFCANYSSSRAELNSTTWNAALEILNQMPDLRSFHVLLSYECWRDYFCMQSYKTSPSCLTPPAWALEEMISKVAFQPEDVLPFLGWVKEITIQGEVVVQMVQKHAPSNGSKRGHSTVTRFHLENNEFKKME